MLRKPAHLMSVELKSGAAIRSILLIYIHIWAKNTCTLTESKLLKELVLITPY